MTTGISQVGRYARTLLLIAIIFWPIVLSTRGQAQKALARAVRIPLYAPGRTNAAAVVRISRLFTESKRKGFFRIGPLRCLVAEGVAVELKSGGPLPQGLIRFGPELFMSGEERFVVRSFTLGYPDERPLLEAAELAFEKDRELRLREGVVRSGGRQTRFHRGVLSLRERDFGQLRYEVGKQMATRMVLSTPTPGQSPRSTRP